MIGVVVAVVAVVAVGLGAVAYLRGAPKKYTPGILATQTESFRPDPTPQEEADFERVDAGGMVDLDLNYIGAQLAKTTLAEMCALSYLKTYIYVAKASGIFETPVFKRAMAGSDENLRLVGDFVKTLSAGVKAGNGIGGPVGAAIGAVVSACAGLVSMILDVGQMDRETENLRHWMAEFADYIGPPPAALLHFAERVGCFYDAKTWEIGLHIHLCRLYIAAQKAGWPVDQAGLVDAQRLMETRNQYQVNILPCWEWWKPESRLGPWFMYAFHPSYTIGRLAVKPAGMRDDAFYLAYKKQIKTRPEPWQAFQFSTADFQIALVNSYGEAGCMIFEIGHDPFSYSTQISMSGGYLQRLTLPTGRQDCWLTSPRGEPTY